MLTVADILNSKGRMVLCVDQHDSVYEAITLMSEINVGAVLVKRHEQIAGIFTERDYLQKIALNARSSHDTAVRDVMTSPVISAKPEDSVEECMEVMNRCRCRHLPVVENERLLGIISIGDLIKSLLDEREYEISQLSQYISGSY